MDLRSNSEYWFKWFFENWADFNPGDLIDKGLAPVVIAERFIQKYDNNIKVIAMNQNHQTKDALNDYKKLSECEILILDYFLRKIEENFR